MLLNHFSTSITVFVFSVDMRKSVMGMAGNNLLPINSTTNLKQFIVRVEIGRVINHQANFLCFLDRGSETWASSTVDYTLQPNTNGHN